ncbi:recombinase family protein [Salegentibacter sp. JZCK2]|uniref:recombinase family protein n=1 Tax=Salegentibacter tibetensis TaxID=2873600 RepID=UPI001CCA5129|nr:recombinase family protein [Salegentibacter tibetensis]MBZ9731536.1 recombinase family protein [Salegentibacter tibetensis]
MKYIAYYRTSTKDQDLGIEAQKRLVKNVLKEGDKIIQSYQEKVSGKGIKDRHEFHKALEACENTEATLLIAKLDRLSRDKHLIFDLQKRKVKFLVADNPNANEVIIDIMAILAHDEVKKISERTKAALAELKEKGVKLGTPENLTQEARMKGVEAIKEKAKSNPNTKPARAFAQLLRDKGKNWVEIAGELNTNGYKSSRGGKYYPHTAKRLLS